MSNEREEPISILEAIGIGNPPRSLHIYEIRSKGQNGAGAVYILAEEPDIALRLTKGKLSDSQRPENIEIIEREANFYIDPKLLEKRVDESTI